MKNVFFFEAAVFSVFCAALAGCDPDRESGSLPGSGMWEIVPAWPSGTDGLEGVDSYDVYFYLFNGMSGECLAYQGASSFNALKPVIMDKAAYDMVVFMAEDSRNISFEASEDAVRTGNVTVLDMSDAIPDMVLGSAAVQSDVSGPVALSEVRRLVGGLDISISNVPEEVRGIEVTVGGLYDMVSFEGAFGFSSGGAATRTLAMTASGSTYSVKDVLLPSDVSLSVVPVSFRVYSAGGTADYEASLDGGIVAGQTASLSAEAADVFRKGGVSLSLAYSPWDAVQTLTDNIDMTVDPWVSEPLPIGGGSTYDNFWASSSLAGCADSYLYDGIKDADNGHADMYWCPDVSWDKAPCWYIDLGAQREGVTVTWWNKFGGAGGQKILTLDIYGSNDAADYGGGNSSWVHVTTVTSDRTAPTVDAGAMVTSGRIEFDGGMTSYRYLKCTPTSRVSNTGETIQDADVNVSEVEITVWNCN